MYVRYVCIMYRRRKALLPPNPGFNEVVNGIEMVPLCTRSGVTGHGASACESQYSKAYFVVDDRRWLLL